MRSYYFLREQNVRIRFGPGRHPTSGAMFLYFEGPDGMIFEYSTGVRLITDEERYTPRQFPIATQSFCAWGSKPDIPEFATPAGTPLSDRTQEWLPMHARQLRVAARAVARAGLVHAYGHCSLRIDAQQFMVTPPKALGLVVHRLTRRSIVPTEGALPHGALPEVLAHQGIFRRAPRGGRHRPLPVAAA